MIYDLNEERLRAAIDRAVRTLAGNKAADGLTGELCSVFGTPSHAIETPERDLRLMCALPDKLAFALSLTVPVARYMLGEHAAQSDAVTTVELARRRLVPQYLGAHYECGYMICLTKQGRFIKCAPLRMGSVDEAPFYMRIIVETALASGGDCFIIAHNHPGGSRIASADDCASTLNALDAMAQLGLVLIDHLVMANGEAISIRKTGSIAVKVWNRLAPLPDAFRDWLN